MDCQTVHFSVDTSLSDEHVLCNVTADTAGLLRGCSFGLQATAIGSQRGAIPVCASPLLRWPAS